MVLSEKQDYEFDCHHSVLMLSNCSGPHVHYGSGWPVFVGKGKRKVVTIQNKNSLALNKYGEQFFLLSSLLSYYSVLKFV